MEQQPKRVRRILFVCLGNICRSPAAEGIMRATIQRLGDPAEWTVDSAGTGDYHVGDLPDARMRRAAAARGYRLDHICRQIRRSDLQDYDLIVGMDANNIRDLRRMAATDDELRRIVPMSRWIDPAAGYDYIPDPYYEGREGFELVLDLLEDSCERMYRELQG